MRLISRSIVLWRALVHGGGVGPDYNAQSSTNLAGWTDLFTINSPALPFDWTDNAASTMPRRFYRVIVEP